MAALVELVRAGEISPSAAEVAAQAGVGLRSVFRHFKDMEGLFKGMTEIVEAELRAEAAKPFMGVTWRERVLEIVDRRSVGFEGLAPIRRAADVRRHTSPVLQDDYERFAAGLRHILRLQLPTGGIDASLLDVLDLLLSFEAWSRLRTEQGLTPIEAREVLRFAVRTLIGDDDAAA